LLRSGWRVRRTWGDSTAPSRPGPGRTCTSARITAAGANTRSSLAARKPGRQNPDHALARLICPRKLRPSTAYHAFLIPSFEVGRLAGLGQSTANKDALLPSWGAGQSEYPVYYRWYFRTGERGDFEYLVSRRAQAGARGHPDMDMQNPNFGADGMSAGPNDEPVMGLEGVESLRAQPRPPYGRR
jgi:hypothetical protein